MHAKKSLGQHFLRDRNIAMRIASAVSPDTRRVLEVGPGHGMLTQFLAGRFETLLLVEKDAQLAEKMRAAYAAQPSVHVAEADFLTYDMVGFFQHRQFSLVGNFPYYISSQIVFRMLEFKEQVPEMIGMFQYEMARRIVAGPGSKEYGIISVLASAAYTGEMLFRVAPGSFDPPPNVESAVIRLTRKENFSLPCKERTLRMVVKTAFGQRRKMMRNTLRAVLPVHVLVDPIFVKRPEQLPLAAFIEIALLVEQYES